ncbi:PREDICTED: LOW QUALITY PROTEIN: F-box protein At1g67130-like [Camelina sativa]|uniref:LOW QUALITY PROTEIN: F-box protein At1g67130-like n=1 Tax=Camelina sativa TaxID=90675 RepID=A0ABM1R652_CAMSA|nr:PREDICTED: LOW QUALITY PROTEIN: F-box protein At1g67130-like [Camelina sativa]
MNRANSDSIPNDLLLDILSRLPSKSIARFRCVSKLWKSSICQPYFTELFFIRSSTRPRLLVGVEKDGEWSFFSSPQPQNLDEKSSLVVAAYFHTKLFEGIRSYSCSYSYASGLIYFSDLRIPNEDADVLSVICNPSTGQCAILPPKLRTTSSGDLGFDPIGKQFKGKLGVINWKYSEDGGFPLELCMWVLEDLEKQEVWSTYAYTLRAEDKFVKVNKNLRVVGVTASGEIVLAKTTACKPFYVFYFSPERNTLQSVEIQGVTEEEEWYNNPRVYYFVDHVEDLNKFDTLKIAHAATSINPPE